MAATEAPSPSRRRKPSTKRPKAQRQASNPFLLLSNSNAPSLLPASASLAQLSLQDYNQLKDDVASGDAVQGSETNGIEPLPFPSTSTEHLDTLKASLRTRLDSDQQARARSASLRSRKGSDVSSVHQPNKLRKRRPSEQQSLQGVSDELSGSADSSVVLHDPVLEDALENQQLSVALDQAGHGVDNPPHPISNPNSNSSSLADQSASFATTNISFEDSRALEDAVVPKTPKRCTLPYLSITTRIHYLLSLPMYSFLSFLSSIPVIRLFVPELEVRPPLKSVLSLSLCDGEVQEGPSVAITDKTWMSRLLGN